LEQENEKNKETRKDIMSSRGKMIDDEESTRYLTSHDQKRMRKAKNKKRNPRKEKKGSRHSLEHCS